MIVPVTVGVQLASNVPGTDWSAHQAAASEVNPRRQLRRETNEPVAVPTVTDIVVVSRPLHRQLPQARWFQVPCATLNPVPHATLTAVSANGIEPVIWTFLLNIARPPDRRCAYDT